MARRKSKAAGKPKDKRPAIRCALEKARFPADQFREDLIHGCVHETELEHTTSGEYLVEVDLPGLPAEVIEEVNGLPPVLARNP